MVRVAWHGHAESTRRAADIAERWSLEGLRSLRVRKADKRSVRCSKRPGHLRGEQRNGRKGGSSRERERERRPLETKQRASVASVSTTLVCSPPPPPPLPSSDENYSRQEFEWRRGFRIGNRPWRIHFHGSWWGGYRERGEEWLLYPPWVYELVEITSTGEWLRVVSFARWFYVI